MKLIKFDTIEDSTLTKCCLIFSGKFIWFVLYLFYLFTCFYLFKAFFIADLHIVKNQFASTN